MKKPLSKQRSHQGRRERGDKGRVWGASPPTISWSKIFFPCKIGKHKNFTYKEHDARVYLLNKT